MSMPAKAESKISIPKAFERGNYALVAARGETNDWRSHAAKAMLADHPEAIAVLEREPGESARYHLGVLHFLDGDDDKAIDVLKTCHLAEARRLRSLIEKPTIHVLAQMPWFRRAPHNLLAGARCDDKFRIRNVSFHEDDTPNRPGASIWDFVDRNDPPDLYFCSMLEWHVIPENIYELDCPLIGMTTDYDVLIQTVHPWLSAFDLLVTTDPGQWDQLSRITNRSVVTYPRCFTLSPELADLPGPDRELDLLLSGTIAHPYHLDRSAFLCEVLRQTDISVRMVQGFLSDAAYQTLLGQAKTVYSYLRVPGGMPTRALEALSMGCAVVVQEGSTLSLFFDEKTGVTTYPSTPEGLIEAIRKVRDEWERFGPAAQEGARLVRRSFDQAKVGSRLLRFMAFLGSRAQQTRTREALRYKRPIVSKGAVAGSDSNQVALRKRAYADLSTVFREKPGAGPLIDMARELILEHAYASRLSEAESTQDLPTRPLIDEALKLSSTGMAVFGDSLVLRFNAVRAGYYFGRPGQRREAMTLARETVAQEHHRWKADRFDDVLPWDFYSQDFNYRDYIECTLEEMGRGGDQEPLRIRLILASLSHLLARDSGSLEDARRAVDLDPGFPYYRLLLAERLLTQGDADNRMEARHHLENLADGTVVFSEVAHLLEHLQMEDPIPTEDFVRLVTPARRYEDFTYTIEKLDEENASRSTDEPTKTYEEKRCIEISILIPYCETMTSLEETLRLLCLQDRSDRCQLIVASPRDAGKKQPLLEQRGVSEHLGIFADVLVVEQPAAFQERGASAVEALQACARQARAPLLIVARPGQQFVRGGLRKLWRAIDSMNDVDVVYADYRRLSSVDLSSSLAKSLSLHKGRDFSRWALFAADIIGPAAIWRRHLLTAQDFDPDFGSAAEYAFFLAASAHASFSYLEREIALVWGPTGELYCEGRRPLEVCRRRYWCSNWGEVPSRARLRALPSEFERMGLVLEASLHREIGNLSDRVFDAVESLAGLITTAILEGDSPLALAALASCRYVAPSLAAPHLAEGRLLEAIGRDDEAAKAYEIAASATPYRTAGLTKRGLLQHRQGDLRGAIESLEVALSEKVSSPFARDSVLCANLGALWLISDKPGRAEEYYRSAIAVDSDDPEAYRGLAAALARQGKETGSRDVLARAHALAPQWN